MKRLFFSCLTLLLLSLTTSCATDDFNFFGTLHGVVTDGTTGRPVSGVTVQLQPGGETQITGSDGAFRFTELTPQQYTIMVQKSGYKTNRKSVTAISGEEIKVDIPIFK